jgi:hypothetical protein
MKNISTTFIIGSLTMALAMPIHAQDAGQKSGNAECNAPVAAVIGGIAGALLGQGKNHIRGAAIGAGVASLACMAFNFQTAQTRTAQQVQDEYKVQNGGQLPGQPIVTSYETRIVPSEKVRPGSKATLNSSIVVVNGATGIAPRIEEEVSLFDPDGKRITQTRKIANQNGEAGGAFTTSFSFALPEGVKQGVYPVKTALFLDGQQASAREAALQVVMTQTGPVFALLSR